MKILVTGASGFIGSAVVADLVAAGHEVTGLARSDASAAVIQDMGADVCRGDLSDLDGLREAASAVDGVVHLAANHDWAHIEEAFRLERAAVQALGDCLADSGRPFVLASGVAFGLDGTVTEQDRIPDLGPMTPRGGSETVALGYADKGVRVVPVRFAPVVHGEGDHAAFIPTIAAAARRRGASTYVGEGANRWPAVHRWDAARLVRLGLENAPAGTILHAVAEEGVPVRRIAEALADRLGVPVRSASAHQMTDEIPFIGQYMSGDFPATSEQTRALLDWVPVGPTLLEDIAAGHYDQD